MNTEQSVQVSVSPSTYELLVRIAEREDRNLLTVLEDATALYEKTARTEAFRQIVRGLRTA